MQCADYFALSGRKKSAYEHINPANFRDNHENLGFDRENSRLAR